MLGIVTGMVAGLGTITPASGFVGPMGALVIGVAAGIAVLLRDAALQAHAAHRRLARRVRRCTASAACIGTLLTGVFVDAALGGAGYAEGMTIGHAAGRRSRSAWSRRSPGARSLTWVILKVLDATLGLRVSDEQETEGLDLASHGERGYSP